MEKLKTSRFSKFVLYFLLSFLGFDCNMAGRATTPLAVPRAESAKAEEVEKIEMNLSAFGVESDRYPNISAIVDLKTDTSYCDVSYYAPKYRAFTYRLTKVDMDSVRRLIASCDIRNLKRKYTVSMTDMPSSTTIFYLLEDTIKISDYGLEGPCPLNGLYRLVYKPERTIQE